MRASELYEARQGSLYVGMKIEYFDGVFQRNGLLATSIQRYSPQGKPLADPDFKYRGKHGTTRGLEKVLADPNVPDRVKQDMQDWYESEWYLGISSSRNINFAAQWGDIVFELDYAKISQRYKVIPWNWGSSPNKYKGEFEEFIVMKKAAKAEFIDTMRFVKPTEDNPKLPLSYVKGFYLSQRYLKYHTDAEVQAIQNKPMFLGQI